MREMMTFDAVSLKEQIEAMFEQMRQANQLMRSDQAEIERLTIQTAALLADLQQREWHCCETS